MIWRKSSFSGAGNCVELGRNVVEDNAWKKSTFSQVNGCVEVTNYGDAIQVRDSKDPTGPTLTFTQDELRAFVEGVKAGEFDDFVA